MDSIALAWILTLPVSIVLAGGLFYLFNRVEATIVTGGAFWGMKNLTQDQDPRRMTVSLHEERASVAPFGDPDWHTEFAAPGLFQRLCALDLPDHALPAHDGRGSSDGGGDVAGAPCTVRRSPPARREDDLPEPPSNERPSIAA
jgi:hypothetical protein